MVQNKPERQNPVALTRTTSDLEQWDRIDATSRSGGAGYLRATTSLARDQLFKDFGFTDLGQSHLYRPDSSDPTMRRIVLCTAGTLGDLHPFLALAQALQARGFKPILAVAEDHLGKAAAAGIEAVAVLPSFRQICVRMGLGEGEATGLLMGNQRKLFEQMVLPDLASSTDKLDALAADADLIVAASFVLAAPIVAEKRKLPLVSVVLQPMALLSALDPPRTRDFWMMAGAPASRVATAWNRAVYAMLREALQGLYGRTIDQVRADHGLLPVGGRRMFEANGSAALTIGCYSSYFAPLPSDAPVTARLVGFPLFDSESGVGNDLDPALEAFLAEGPPPLVFTLGTFATHAPGDFYIQAAAVARRLGRRAVLLTGRHSAAQSDPSIFECAYAPHSRVFPYVAAIVHHGGIGTTGQALRAGKPQLVVPHMGDQNDHADRIVQLGVGLTLKPARFTADQATPILALLLNNQSIRDAAARIGACIRTETAAAEAASLIAQELKRRADADAVFDRAQPLGHNFVPFAHKAHEIARSAASTIK